MHRLVIFILLIAAIFLLGLVFGSFYTVQQQSRAIIERFGRYVRTARPGLNFKMPPPFQNMIVIASCPPGALAGPTACSLPPAPLRG